MSDWETVRCSGTPHAHHGNGSAEIGGQFYVFDGRRTQPVDVFDPATQTWSHCSPPPMEIHHFQPVIIGADLCVIGTMTGMFPRETPLETVYIDTPASDTWREGPAVPQRRRRGGAGCVHHDGATWIAVGSGALGGEPELSCLKRMRP